MYVAIVLKCFLQLSQQCISYVSSGLLTANSQPSSSHGACTYHNTWHYAHIGNPTSLYHSTTASTTHFMFHCRHLYCICTNPCIFPSINISNNTTCRYPPASTPSVPSTVAATLPMPRRWSGLLHGPNLLQRLCSWLPALRDV